MFFWGAACESISLYDNFGGFSHLVFQVLFRSEMKSWEEPNRVGSQHSGCSVTALKLVLVFFEKAHFKSGIGASAGSTRFFVYEFMVVVEDEGRSCNKKGQ